jgi:hypothetical protein
MNLNLHSDDLVLISYAFIWICVIVVNIVYSIKEYRKCKYNTTLEFEKWILENLAPNDLSNDPAFPNHTDIDIWLVGFKKGYDYAYQEAKEEILKAYHG